MQPVNDIAEIRLGHRTRCVVDRAIRCVHDERAAHPLSERQPGRDRHEATALGRAYGEVSSPGRAAKRPEQLADQQLRQIRRIGSKDGTLVRAKSGKVTQRLNDQAAAVVRAKPQDRCSRPSQFLGVQSAQFLLRGWSHRYRRSDKLEFRYQVARVLNERASKRDRIDARRRGRADARHDQRCRHPHNRVRRA